MPGEEVFFASARSQAHFIFSKKVPGKKCHLLPHLPRHLTFFSVVSSPGIFCVFGDKSAWGKKVPGSQAARLPHIMQACWTEIIYTGTGGGAGDKYEVWWGGGLTVIWADCF